MLADGTNFLDSILGNIGQLQAAVKPLKPMPTLNLSFNQTHTVERFLHDNLELIARWHFRSNKENLEKI